MLDAPGSEVPLLYLGWWPPEILHLNADTKRDVVWVLSVFLLFFGPFFGSGDKCGFDDIDEGHQPAKAIVREETVWED